ncbi:MAG: hypothetical protein KKE64_03370, partial [Candidatus Omnitrophica bacterium]|nr:hypothetical protein [Candidatus Omnitrophota bacterium]
FLSLIIFINLYLRTFPAYFPQYVDFAKKIVDQRLRFQSAQEIEGKFGNFSSLAKDRLLKNEITNAYKKNPKFWSLQLSNEYLRLKNKHQDSLGQTYLMELDCWHWARYTENIVRLGHPGDKIVRGKNVDTLMLAPKGSNLHWDNFLYYSSAFIYKIFNFFKRTPLFTFLFYIPLFYVFVFLVVLYFFAYRFGANIAGIISCLFVGLCPLFVPRSCLGWYDKDILNLLFPVLIFMTYLQGFDTQSRRKRFFLLIFSSFWLGLFCFTWLAWWFVLPILILYELFNFITIFYGYLRHKNNRDYRAVFKKHLVYLFSFLFLGSVWIILFCGFQPFKFFFGFMIDALTLNKPLNISIWPNVYSTVGELRRSTYLEISRSIGGNIIFALSLLSIPVVFWFTRKDAGYKRGASIILFIWFLSMFYACFKGVRFVVFLSVPLALFLGWGISCLSDFFKRKNRLVTTLATGCLVIYLSGLFINNGFKSAKTIYPLMDDVWYRLLSVVRENTPQESILNSWWDFGDWFKVVARRAVIFDGQSQNVPQAHWMARVFLSTSEEEALRILRMLNNGGNDAFEIINARVKDPYRSIFILNSLISGSPGKEKARGILDKYLNKEGVDKVLGLLFDVPQRAYFIVDPTLASKMHAFSYLGKWDFSRVYLMQSIRKKEKNQVINYLEGLGLKKDSAQKLYQEANLIADKDLDNWVSSRYQFFSGILRGQEKDNVVYFENGFIYNPNQQTIVLFNPQDGQYKIPRSLFILQEDEIVEIPYPNANLGFSILVFKTDKGYQAVSLSRELGKSLFVRLYYLGGVGLKYFKLFAEGRYERDNIRFFRILWD